MPVRKNASNESPVISDIDDPRTWHRYRKKMCPNCWAGCCTLLVEVTAQDLILLELTDNWEINNDFKSLTKRLKKMGVIQRYHSKSDKFVLEQNSDGSCIYLDSHRNCKVYAKRPLVCRNHPRVVSSRLGYCPYIPKDHIR